MDQREVDFSVFIHPDIRVCLVKQPDESIEELDRHHWEVHKAVVELEEVLGDALLDI